MTLDRLVRDLPNPATTWGGVFYAVLIFALAWLAAHVVKAAVRRALHRHGDTVPTRSGAMFVAELAQVGIYIVALTFYAHVIPSLRHLGTALLASVGVVSVVLGIAAQHTLGNLVAGVAILLYRPFRLGDQVQVAAPTGLETGVVERLSLGYTILRTFDNRRIVVPNTLMATQVSVNLTAVDPHVLVLVPFTISYAADVQKARDILLELAATHPKVEKATSCPVTDLGPSGVALSLRAWCASMDATYQVKWDLYEQAKERFDRAGIEIASPSMSVALREDGSRHGSPSSDAQRGTRPS